MTNHPCYGVECGNHGSCSRGNCVCEAHYCGESCETHDSCCGIDCGQHGSCSRGSCECDAGYTGDRCQVRFATLACSWALLLGCVSHLLEFVLHLFPRPESCSTIAVISNSESSGKKSTALPRSTVVSVLAIVCAQMIPLPAGFDESYTFTGPRHITQPDDPPMWRDEPEVLLSCYDRKINLCGTYNRVAASCDSQLSSYCGEDPTLCNGAPVYECAGCGDRTGTMLFLDIFSDYETNDPRSRWKVGLDASFVRNHCTVQYEHTQTLAESLALPGEDPQPPTTPGYSCYPCDEQNRQDYPCSQCDDALTCIGGWSYLNYVDFQTGRRLRCNFVSSPCSGCGISIVGHTSDGHGR